MKTRIWKWGNDLGLRIPRSLAREAGVGDGSTVDITAQNGDLLVHPVRRPQYSLSELLADVNQGNLHGEISTGDPVRSERW